MPDITVSFTDAQWTRIVAASSQFKRPGDGDVDAAHFIAAWKYEISQAVKGYEKEQASADDF